MTNVGDNSVMLEPSDDDVLDRIWNELGLAQGYIKLRKGEKHLGGKHNQQTHAGGTVSAHRSKGRFGENVVYELDGVEGSELQVVSRSDGTRAVATFLVPEKARGKGFGQQLLKAALQDGPIAVESSGGVSDAYRRVQRRLQEKGEIIIEEDEYGVEIMRLPSTTEKALQFEVIAETPEIWQLYHENAIKDARFTAKHLGGQHNQ